MHALCLPLLALVVAAIQGCQGGPHRHSMAHDGMHGHSTPHDGQRLLHGKPRPPARCVDNGNGECEIDVLPTADWVPDYIDATMKDGKYPAILWKLDARGPFKFGTPGIAFTDPRAPFANCRSMGRHQFRCENHATAAGGPWAYVVNLQFDPFVWNR